MLTVSTIHLTSGAGSPRLTDGNTKEFAGQIHLTLGVRYLTRSSVPVPPVQVIFKQRTVSVG